MKFQESDIPPFKKEVCPKCVAYESCLKKYWNNIEWFFGCPKLFNWKLGIKTIYEQQKEWEIEHPEETAQRKLNYQKYQEQKKQIASEKRKAKYKANKEKKLNNK